MPLRSLSALPSPPLPSPPLCTLSSIPRDLVMECLGSHDESIRLRALDLIIGMVNKKNLVDIIRQLVAHVDESESACQWKSCDSHVMVV